MADLNASDVPKWAKFVTDFDNQYAAFSENYAALLSMRDWVYEKNPDIVPQYEKLIQDGAKHKKTLDQLKKVRDTVAKWLDGIKRITGILPGLGNMGALPLIPVAIGVGAASAALLTIGNWIKDAYFLAQNLNERRRLEEQGVPPAEAARLANQARPPARGLFGIDMRWLVIGAGLFLAWPYVSRALEDKRG